MRDGFLHLLCMQLPDTYEESGLGKVNSDNCTAIFSVPGSLCGHVLA
jgi:hypothetical protein